jgi:glutamyl-tRNA reductase
MTALSRLALVGLSHRTAPIEVRERISVPAEEVPGALRELRQIPGLVGAALVSTCNRTEAVCELDEGGTRGIVEALARIRELEPSFLESYLYVYEGEEAVRHLFRVAASLDSLIVGEGQIVAQVKTAYGLAQEQESLSGPLHQLFQSALAASKKVRAQSGIGESAVSVPYAAVELAKKIFDDFSKCQILIIGTGKMGEIATRHIKGLGTSRIFCANRTLEKATTLAEKFGGAAIRLEDIPLHLADTDIVISSTGAPGIVLGKEAVAEAMHERRNRPMFLIDIALPRDIGPEVATIPNVYLYDIDDLRDVVDRNRRNREAKVERAEALLGVEIEQFLARLAASETVPTIQRLRGAMEDLRRQELERTRKRLGGLTPEQEAALDDLTASIVNKILHYPIAHLKSAPAEDGGVRETIRKIFGLK